ncbi:cytosolic protein [Bacillus sp. PS06]|uniref:cytosolic protein n=1 Tax=Bacillus sp. PS06 TaxID=2764176 RepID=UPI00177EA60A|nr:cytosolic protein [Bacillus sp. PS06]MBD8071211.1 cytosolic protein [Bacillus sp. PS06]
MYTGRDMTELSMISKHEWTDAELEFHHRSLQQMVPYLNVEGQTIHRSIVEEIEARGGLKQMEEVNYSQGIDTDDIFF